jgi:hypothetical protein
MHDQDDADFRAEGRVIALNFLDFLSETRGLFPFKFTFNYLLFSDHLASLCS